MPAVYQVLLCTVCSSPPPHYSLAPSQDDGVMVTRLVVGNESCDLDSVACTLSLSHFYWSTVGSSFFSIPLLNCLREDLSLRQDIVWLLNHLQIDSTHFMFLSEVNLSDLPHPRVTLVDHNVPDENIRPFVDEIIDHHDDAYTFECSRVIEPVGSCSTLVGERLLSSEDYKIPSDVATFLLAAILIDTGNLKMESRVTPKDIEVAEKLGSLVSLSSDQLYYNVSISLKFIIIIIMSYYYTLPFDGFLYVSCDFIIILGP